MPRRDARRCRPSTCCALLLQVLYSIRSERMLIEPLEYHLLFRWFVGLAMDAAVRTPTTFTKNREAAARRRRRPGVFRGRRGASAGAPPAVGRALYGRWHAARGVGGPEEFPRKDQPPTPPDDPGNPTVNFHGERRSNTTQQSTTYPDSRLFKKAKGHEAKLGYLGEVPMENRHGLVVDACVVPATGTD